MYIYLKQRIKHAIRFRHKRGYGVHSPFVFDLIFNVIRERGEYYNFKIVEEQNKIAEKNKKLYRLVYRLADYFQYRNVLVIGAKSSLIIQYLSRVSKDMKFYDVSSGRIDLIYVGAKFNNPFDIDKIIADNEDHQLCIIIKDIHKKNIQMWRKLSNMGEVSIDMMWYGIIFFDSKLQKGKYNLII